MGPKNPHFDHFKILINKRTCCPLYAPEVNPLFLPKWAKNIFQSGVCISGNPDLSIFFSKFYKVIA